jgi:hypothetical protein
MIKTDLACSRVASVFGGIKVARILVLAAIMAIRMGATTVSGPCPVTTFTLGHMTISNCQTNITYTIPTDGYFTPLGFAPDGVLLGNILDVTEVGMVVLGSAAVAQSFDGTVTASFAMDPGWALAGVTLLAIAEDDGPLVSENVFLDAPCVTLVGGDSSGTGTCSLPSSPHSGAITLELSIHSDPQCAMCFADSGQVGGGTILLTQVVAPEPGTALFLGLGLAFSVLWRGSSVGPRALVAHVSRAVLPTFPQR